MTPAPPPAFRPPRLARRDDAVYVRDPRTRAWWRVHWVAFGTPPARPFGLKRLATGDGRANHLWFVQRDGTTCCTYLGRDGDWAISAEVLTAHLLRAGVPAKPWVTPASRGTLGS
jgi:hypothetical protein